MRKARLQAALALGVTLLACGACASQTIHDVTLSAVRAVDSHDQTELPLPGDMRPYIALMAGDPAILKGPPVASGRHDAKTTERPHMPMLKVEFTSTRDLSKLDSADNLSTESFFCRRPDAKVLLGGAWIYSDGQMVLSGREEAVQRSSAPTGPLYTYYTFFWVVRSDSHPGDKPIYESFDLLRNPEDICFRLVGGNYRMFGYYSNTVTIPKALIARALSQAPRER